MATIKSFTGISQSKNLAEILSLESADMLMFNNVGESGKVDGTNTSAIFKEYFNPLAVAPEILPCWSLAALLELMPKQFGRYTKSLYWFDNAWHCEYIDENSEAMNNGTSADNPVDACYEMIVKLHELNLL